MKKDSRKEEDRVQIFKHPESFNTYPREHSVTEHNFSENRFKHFVKTFEEFYDKIKANLLKSKAFNLKYKERCERLIEIYTQKNLVKESYSCSSNVREKLADAAYTNELIEKLNARIKEKEALIRLKERIASDAQAKKSAINSEIQASIDERVEKLTQILANFESLSKEDVSFLPSSPNSLSEPERHLIKSLTSVIFLMPPTSPKLSSLVPKTLKLLQDPSKLTSILRARKDTNFSEI